MARKTSTEVLQEAFPGRGTLSPKEVAGALHGTENATRKRVERVREALDDGTLIPGLRKVGERWQVPIAALGAALDARRQPPPSEELAVPTRRSRHSTIGPRMLLQVERSRAAWHAIAVELEAVLTVIVRAELESVIRSDLPEAPPAARLGLTKRRRPV